MINIEQMVEFYRDLGYSDRSANARACQDIILKAISQSSMGRKVTIKGGVVMRSISGDRRRATDDLDLDFLRYSEYYVAAEPPVRCGESHLSGQAEPPVYSTES